MSKSALKLIRRGYAIFCPTVFQGTMPACYEDDYPVVFATEREAQLEIADNQLIRIQQFIDRERDFADAITTDEFALPVSVLSDGNICTENGRKFGKQEEVSGLPRYNRLQQNCPGRCHRTCDLRATLEAKLLSQRRRNRHPPPRRKLHSVSLPSVHG